MFGKPFFATSQPLLSIPTTILFLIFDVRAYDGVHAGVTENLLLNAVVYAEANKGYPLSLLCEGVHRRIGTV